MPNKVFELRWIDDRDYYTHYDELVGYFSTRDKAVAASVADGKGFDIFEGPFDHRTPTAYYGISEMHLEVDGQPVEWSPAGQT